MGVNPRDDRDTTVPFREAMKQEDNALKRFVAQHFEGAGRKPDEVVKGMLEAEDFYANEIFQVKTQACTKDALSSLVTRATHQISLVLVRLSPSPAPMCWRARSAGIRKISQQVIKVLKSK